MLHILNKRIEYDVFFQRIAREDALIFLGSSVLCLPSNAQTADQLTRYCQNFQCYVLESDLLARGLKCNEIIAGIQPIDYSGFVALTTEHEVIKTWN
ncbi:MAG: sulfurtransferase complex subunit TusB [Methyloprofundus sp.]|nr:sulfurtransferase complex subunit TusB [Methyloprofundus sp.]MDT8426547.1 sulfurtransferase complex subunit TusB [Methyloprofundus sp.]